MVEYFYFLLLGEPKSGRTSTASSSMEERSVSGSTRLSADNSTIKCALCPETFSDSAALQAHTLAHFDGGSADALLREKLLKSKKKKHKKKKRKKREHHEERSIPPVQEQEITDVSKPGKKGKKVYACVLCNMTFSKKSSWGIHKIRHNGKGWKCRFCNSLHEDRDKLISHLEGIHRMNIQEINMLGIIKNANMFTATRTSKKVKSDDLDDDEEEDDDSSGDDSNDDVPLGDVAIESEDSKSLVETNPPFPDPGLSITPSFQAGSQVSSIASLLTAQDSSAKSSPTPSVSSGSSIPGLPPALKFVSDPSQFDLDTLTCLACNKSFKNTRAFKLHRDRHQGLLNHKCPDCSKTFNGRSEVNRHMLAIHHRSLKADEETNQKQVKKVEQSVLQQNFAAEVKDVAVVSNILTDTCKDTMAQSEAIEHTTKVSPLKCTVNDISINDTLHDGGNSRKSQIYQSIPSVENQDISAGKEIDKIEDLQSQIPEVLDKQPTTNTSMSQSAISIAPSTSQKLAENSLNNQDDEQSFDGNVTPILDSDSDDDCFIINENEVLNKTVPTEIQTPLPQENALAVKEVTKAEKIVPSMPMLDLGLDMPSLLEPEKSERSKKKEVVSENSSFNDDEFDKLFQTVKKSDEKKRNAIHGCNEDTLVKTITPDTSVIDKTGGSDVIASAFLKNDSVSQIDTENSLNEDEYLSSINDNEDSMDADLDISSSPNTPTVDESLFDLDDEKDLEEYEPDRKEFVENSKERGSKVDNKEVADGDGTEENKSSGEVVLNASIPIITDTNSDTSLNKNENDKVRLCNESKDKITQNMSSAEECFDVKKSKVDEDIVTHDGEVGTLMPSQKSGKEKKDIDENVALKESNDSASSHVKQFNDTKPLEAVKESCKETILDKEEKTNSKISVIKSDKSEQIVDSISIRKENKSNEGAHSETEGPQHDKDEKSEKSDKSNQNSDTVPVKKKVKSFASAMSLFLKSKKDTSYVENPIKARKTAKKLKRRRSHKKLAQTAKSPTTNKPGVKKVRRKKRSIESAGETRITRSSQRLKPQSTENTGDEDNKNETTEDESKPIFTKREGTPQLHMEEAAAEIVDTQSVLSNHSPDDETNDVTNISKSESSCSHSNIVDQKENKLLDSSNQVKKPNKGSEISDRSETSKSVSPRQNVKKNEDSETTIDKDANRTIPRASRRKGQPKKLDSFAIEKDLHSMSKTSLSSEFLSEFGESRISQNSLDNVSTIVTDSVLDNVGKEEWTSRKSKKNISSKTSFSIMEKETKDAPKSAFDLLLSSPSSDDKKQYPQSSMSKIKSPKRQMIDADDVSLSKEPTKKNDVKLRPSATSVVLEDLDMNEYKKSSKQKEKCSPKSDNASPQRSPEKSNKSIDHSSDNKALSFNDIILQHTEEFKQKEANVKGLKKSKSSEPKQDETFHRRGRLRMKRPEKIERQSSIQTGESKGFLSMQKRMVEPTAASNDSEVETKMQADKVAEESSTKPEKTTSGKTKNLAEVSAEPILEISQNTRKDDLLADKKSPTRSEPANMSLRTAPRKSSRLISEMGEEKHSKHDISENRRSPQKSAMSPDSKSPGRPKKSQEVDIIAIDKIAKPEGEETDDLMKQKGVTVNKEGKLMIPSQKLSLSEELCKIVMNEKGKKNFVCQICDKVFPRKDKINYHIYSDHHDEFVRLGTGVPQILTKGDALNSSDNSLEDPIEEGHQTETNLSESEDIPLELKRKAAKPSKTSKVEPNSVNIQASEKEEKLISSPIKRSPRKKSECNQNDILSSPSLPSGKRVVAGTIPIEVKKDIDNEKSYKGEKDSSDSLLTYKQPAEIESQHVTDIPVRPRRTSRKGGTVNAAQEDNVSADENKANKHPAKESEPTGMEMSNDISRPNELVQPESKVIGNRIKPTSAEVITAAKKVKSPSKEKKEGNDAENLIVTKSPKDDIDQKKNTIPSSKDEKGIKKKEDIKQEMESDSEDDDDRKSIETLAYALSSTHGKIAKRVHRFFDDIGHLIEIQEDVRRLRNKRLYDSNDAIEIMQRYRYVKQKKYSIKRLQGNKNSFKFKIVKEKAEQRKVVVNESNPMSFKILKLTDHGLEIDANNHTVEETYEPSSVKDSNKHQNDEEKCEVVSPANTPNMLSVIEQSKSENKEENKISDEISPTRTIGLKRDVSPLIHSLNEQNIVTDQNSKPKEELLKATKRKLDVNDTPKRMRQTKTKTDNTTTKNKTSNKLDSKPNESNQKPQKELRQESDVKEISKIKTPEKTIPKQQTTPEKSTVSAKSDLKGKNEESIKDVPEKQDLRPRKRKASAPSGICKADKPENGKTETNCNVISTEKECLKIVIRQSDLGASLKANEINSPKSKAEENHVMPEYKIQSQGNPLKFKLTTGIKPFDAENDVKKNHVKKKKKGTEEKKIKPLKVLKEKIGKEPSNQLEESPIKLVLKLPSLNSTSDISVKTKTVTKKKKARLSNVETNKIVIKGLDDANNTPRKTSKKLKDDIENISLSPDSRKFGLKKETPTGEKIRRVKNEKFVIKPQNSSTTTKEGSNLVEVAGKSPPTFVEKKVAKAMQSKNQLVPNNVNNKRDKNSDLGIETHNESRTNSDALKLPDHQNQPAVTFSPDSSPEHVIGDFGTTSGLGLLGRDASMIGLNEGTFHNVMKLIDATDEDGCDRSGEEKSSNPTLSLVYDKKENVATSVEKSQVDGGFDSLSSVSYSPDPRRFSLDEPLPFVPDKDTKEVKSDDCRSNSRQDSPMNVIQKRMTQANKTKDKPALLKHVFSTYTKRRKIMVVKYRKPKHKIIDLDEYNLHFNEEPLVVDNDECSMVNSVPKDTPSKAAKTKVEENQAKVPPIKIPVLKIKVDEIDEMETSEDISNSESAVNLDCHICKRSFPNRIRLLAHFQMHSDDDAKKKRKKAIDVEPREDLEDLMSMKIDQVDGSTDITEPSASTSSSKDSVISNETLSHVANAPDQQPTAHLLILRRENEDNSNNALMTNGSISLNPAAKVTTAGEIVQMTDSLGAAGSNIYPCPHCNLAFREALDLETHMSLRHGHGKTSQIVTVIRTPQPSTSSVTATSTSLAANDSGLSNGGNIIFNQTSSVFESNVNSSFGTSLISLPMDPLPHGNQHPFLMKQDPVLMSNDFIKEEDEQEDSHSDFMLDESLQLFESHHSSLIDSSDSAIHLSLDDIASFAQPIVDPTTDGSHTSFDTSIETSSFLSGTESHPLEDILSETTTNAATPVSLPESFPHAESRTPSLPDDGEFPCPQCDKKFGNRRNLLSHTRRHTGDFKLFCDDCGKGFFTQSKLDSHKRKHTGEKGCTNHLILLKR